jgi:hypothetical protein
MNLQEMLTTNDPNAITDEQLKSVSYGLTYGEFSLELHQRQQMLQARLREIEAAEKAARRQLLNSLPEIEDDPYCDEYAYR